MNPEIAARLAACRIELLTEAREYSMVGRENCFALLHRADTPDPGIGSSGMMTEAGLAWLVWREGQPYLVAKGNEVAAGIEQVDAIRRFSEDLKKALLAVSS